MYVKRSLLKEWVEGGKRFHRSANWPWSWKSIPIRLCASAYEFLQQEQVIFNQRGVGYFAAADAIQKATGYFRTAFIEKDLPQLFRSLYLLGMDPDELKPRYDRYKQQFFNA